MQPGSLRQIQWWLLRSASEPLQQGDLLPSFVRKQASERDGKAVVLSKTGDYIVITQSCDLENRKVALVLLAPTFSLSDWLFNNPEDFSQLENIRKGAEPTLYLLPSDITLSPLLQEDRVVDLRQVLGAPLSDVLAAGGTPGRVGLASPFLEHFSQAVARSFMRVGLPEDVPAYDWTNNGSIKEKLTQLTGLEELDPDSRISLAGNLTLVGQKRSRGGQQLVVLRTEKQRQVSGVGKDVEGAKASLSRALLRARSNIEWVASVLTIRPAS